MVDGALAHLAVGAAPRGPALDAGASGDRRVEQPPQHPARRAEESSVSKQSAMSSSVAVVATGGEGANERPRVDLETMRGVFARARDMLPEGPPARERVQGYRLVRVLDRNISWVDVRITGEGYAVLGSHDRCDLVLSNDAGIWLRHLVAVCVRLEDNTVGLRLVDLKTDLPFFVDDDTVRWSIIARGPFAMRLGRHVVCGFPIGPGTGDDRQSSSAPERPRISSPQAEPARVKDAGATGVIETGITSAVDARSILDAPGPNELSSFLPAQPVSQIQDLLGASVSADHVRVTLERGGMGASVELPMEALDNGVLLGRALNCFDGGLRRIFCEAISRAHVLIVRDKDDVYAFDLCSTNGTRASGQRIRRYRLSDAGSTLELGKKVLFRWHRREPK